MTKDLKKTEEKAEPKFTRLQVVNMHAKLAALKNVSGNKLNYAINRTLASLGSLVKKFDFKLHVPDTDEWLAYNQALNEGYKDLSKGRTVFTAEGEIMDFDINSEEAKALRVRLGKKYAKLLEERNAAVKEYNKWMEQPCGTGCEYPEEEEYKIHHISASDIDDKVDKAVWDACMEMIVD